MSVEGVREGKIEEYLRRNGIVSMSADEKVFVGFYTVWFLRFVLI